MPPLVKIYDSGRVYYIEPSRIYVPFPSKVEPKKKDPKDKDEEGKETTEDDLWSESSQK